MEIFCINLDCDTEKFKKIELEFGSLFTITRISAIDGRFRMDDGFLGGVRALAQTNIDILESFLISDKKYIIIIEDDIYKLDEFDKYWMQVLLFINDEANRWDFIKLENILLRRDRPQLTPVNNYLSRVSCSRNTGFVIYSREFVTNNIDYIRNCTCFDLQLTHNTNFIQLIPNVIICKQYVDKFSNTAMKNTKHYEKFYNETEDILRGNLAINDSL